MKKMNKKGFTLIELLAVIVVLAIVMVIATQRITNVVNNSRANSFISSYKAIVKQINTNIVADPDNIACTNDGKDGEKTVKKCSDIYDISSDYSLDVKESNDKYEIKLSAVTGGKFDSLNLKKYGDAKVASPDTVTSCESKRIGSGATDCTDKSITGQVKK